MKYNIIFCAMVVTFLSANVYAESNCVHDSSKLKCLEFVKSYSGDTAMFNIPHLHHLLGKEIKISLLGIKAPGVYSKNACTKKVAKKAKSFVKELYKNAKVIEVVDVKRNKSFGLQGRVLVDNQDVSKILLKKNYAVSAVNFKKTDWCKVKI